MTHTYSQLILRIVFSAIHSNPLSKLGYKALLRCVPDVLGLSVEPVRFWHRRKRLRFSNLAVVLALAVSLFGVKGLAQTQSSFVVLNEIEVNNPGADMIECEYMEVRGDPGAFIPSDTYLVEIEGDGAGAGTADFVRNLGFEILGSNGILVVAGASPPVLSGIHVKDLGTMPCGSRSYISGGGTLIQDLGVSLENGTISFLLINSPTTPITQGTDYDTDNNGTLDGLPGDATVVDAVGWNDIPPPALGSSPDRVYGGVNVTPGNAVPPDAATRDFDNIMPLTNAAWFADDISGDIDSVSYDQTNLLGMYSIDFLTPGAQNLAPSAAAATIAGRVLNKQGRGLRFVTVMIAGGELTEPLFATTNMFGRYRFEDIPVGETYVLQVFSKRYIFDQTSMVINLEDSISSADFIGGEAQ